ncbi:MAG TPA: hypothetical protein VK488_04120 [Gaiellaceae bacterium]|nr:hypothetical protein [Gaiellaceae bacterium]
MPRLLVELPRTLLIVLGSLALAACVEGQESAHGRLERISNRGEPVRELSSAQRAILRRATVDPATLRLLRQHQGLGVLTARSLRDEPCYLNASGSRFGFIACGQTRHRFPSRELPMIDFSSLVARPGDAHPRIRALMGIAADGVSRVAVHFARGPSYFVPVVANTYIDRRVPARPAREIVALDSARRALASFPLQVPAAK